MKLIKEFIGINSYNYFIDNKGQVWVEKDRLELVELRKKNKRPIVVIYSEDFLKLKKEFVHKLVARYFVENPNNFEFIIHADKDYENNNSDNLYWNNTSYKKGTDLTGKKPYLIIH